MVCLRKKLFLRLGQYSHATAFSSAVVRGIFYFASLACAVPATVGLSLFDWAPFRSTKAAIKRHTLLDLRGSISAFIHISDGKLHDVNALDILTFEPEGLLRDGSRGYLGFKFVVFWW